MAKTLMGATVQTGGAAEAYYQYEVMGATKVGVKTADWPAAVTDAIAAMISGVQAEVVDVGTVVSVQVYTSITDPVGHPGFSAPGECFDINFPAGSEPRTIRIGDDEAVPSDIATLRDALKAAITAAL